MEFDKIQIPIPKETQRRIIENSCRNCSKNHPGNNEDIDYEKAKHKIPVKRVGFAILAATAVVLWHIALQGIIQEEKIYNALGDTTSIVSDNSAEKGVAFDILEHPDIDKAMYGVFYTVSALGDDEKIFKQMDMYVAEMNRLTSNPHNNFEEVYPYETFSEYLSANGFNDKDGKPDLGVYKERMGDYILAKEGILAAEGFGPTKK